MKFASLSLSSKKYPLFLFKNQKLFQKALTHKSYQYEKKSLGHNERLEFLGDSVLDLVLSHELIRCFPKASEGVLSLWRASLVNQSSLAKIAKDIGLGEMILLGKGEILSQGYKKPRILASAFEALIGAFYLEKGFTKTYKVIQKVFESSIEKLDTELYFEKDYKTRLQEWTQSYLKITPSYKVVGENGPSHQRKYLVGVYLKEEMLDKAEGTSKKEASQRAALQALKKLETQKERSL